MTMKIKIKDFELMYLVEQEPLTEHDLSNNKLAHPYYDSSKRRASETFSAKASAFCILLIILILALA